MATNPHLHRYLQRLIAAASWSATDRKLCTSSCPKYPNSLPSPLPSTITHPSTSPVPGSATGTHIAAHGLRTPAKNHKPPKRASDGASARLHGDAVAMTCDGMCSSGLKGVASKPAFCFRDFAIGFRGLGFDLQSHLHPHYWTWHFGGNSRLTIG